MWNCELITNSNIQRLRNCLASVLTIQQQITPAINGYGRSEMTEVCLAIHDEYCGECGKWALFTTYEDFNQKHKHHWKPKLHVIANGSGKTLDIALSQTELLAYATINQLKLCSPRDFANL